MGLAEQIKIGDWRSVRSAIAKLNTKLGPTAEPTFAGLILTSPLTVPYGGTGLATLTDHGILLGSGTGAITPLAEATDGQIPIGDTGADPVLATITGTANRVTVSNSAGGITLSGPQDLHTSASPQFANINIHGYVKMFDFTDEHYLKIAAADGKVGAANKNLIIDVNDANREITFTGNPTLADWFDQSVKQAASPVFEGLTIGSGAAGVNYALTFVGEDSTGVMTWQEDEDNFAFDRPIAIGTTNAVGRALWIRGFGSDLIRAQSSANVLRTLLNDAGTQTWYMFSGGVERGKLSYTLPGNEIGIAMFNAAGTGRSEIIATATGGLKFYTSTTASQGTLNLAMIPGGNVGINEIAPNAKLDVNGTSRFGDSDTNYLAVSATGVVTLAGTAKRILTLRPDLDFSAITAQGKPTRITYGAYQGYSLPIYAADEELFFNTNVPGRWDEASDITLHVLVCLSQIEDVNDDFRLQLSWANSEMGEPILNTTTDVEVETNLLTGRVAAYDTYDVEFTIDYDADAGNHIVSHDDLVMRLRRVAASGTEITGEVIVLDYHLHFNVDKMFKAT